MEYNWNMAYIYSQEFSATVFETLKFVLKMVLHLTFAQETLESVLICHRNCPPGVHVHLFLLFLVSIYLFLLCWKMVFSWVSRTAEATPLPASESPVPCLLPGTKSSSHPNHPSQLLFLWWACCYKTDWLFENGNLNPAAIEEAMFDPQKWWRGWAASSPHTVCVTHGDSEDTDWDKGHLGFQRGLLIVVSLKNTKAVLVLQWSKGFCNHTKRTRRTFHLWDT